MFTDYAYLPIDLPRLDLDRQQLVEMVRAFGAGISARFDAAKTSGGLMYHLRVNDQGVNQYYNNQIYEGLQWSWKPYAREHLQPLIDYVETHLPYEVITEVVFLCNTGHMHPHRDDSPVFNQTRVIDPPQAIANVNRKKLLEPASYRLVFQESGEKSFYVCKNKFGDKHHVTLPADTNCFVYNDQHFYHGATLPETPKAILRVSGKIDAERHFRLLEQSLTKYPEHAIKFA